MICSGIDCYITATTDPGEFNFEGKLNPGHSIEEAEAVFWNILKRSNQRTWRSHLGEYDE